MKLHVLYVFNSSHFLFLFIISDVYNQRDDIYMFLTQIIFYGTAIPTTRTHGERLSVVGPMSTRRPSPCHSLRLHHVDSACGGRIMIICKTLTRKNQDHIKDSIITLMITGCQFVVCLHELEIQNGNPCRKCLNIWHLR